MASKGGPASTEYPIPPPIQHSPTGNHPTRQNVDSSPIPVIKVDSSEVCFAVTSSLPEAAGVIDPTLLHAPFLREPLFVPAPGSGKRALKRWCPGANHRISQEETEKQRTLQLLSAFKYWLHYEESELYQDISPGQLLQLCDSGKPGHTYEVRAKLGSVGPGIAFWAEPREQEPLPQAVVLFLPPGTYCPPETKALLQELVVENIEVVEVAEHDPSSSQC